eukprot:c32208_g1_i1.p1 GENE.c32208_g1_i1~~c32208_g1_i1.p1  ORF type:complete len:352 (+),score=85.00 c32208_g1_i1:31-1086(+)
MEKYSKWKDPATGIQPFLDVKSGKKRQIDGFERVVWGVKLFIFSPIVCLLRVVLLLIMFAWLALITTIFSLIPIALLRRGLVRYVHMLGCRGILFVAGFHWIQSSTIDPRMRQKQIESSAASRIGNGDIVVCNYTSYIQVLYLSFRLCPTFVSLARCDSSHPKAGHAVTRGVFGALLDALLDRHPDLNSPKLRPLRQIAEDARKHRRGPVVVFAEGTTSNGQAVLRFLPFLTPALLSPPSPAFHVVGTAFEVGQAFASVGASPAVTVGSPVKHVLRLLCGFNHSMSVVYCAAEGLPRAVAPTNPDELAENISKILASLLQLHRALIGAKEKQEFMEYYTKIENTGYKKKQT